MTKRPSLLTCLLLIVTILLVSWGVTGHRAIGKLAENHLSPHARDAVKELLGNESMADVSTWADEVRNEENWRYTEPWHYLNLPLGLNFADFERTVEGMKEPNVYSALLKQEKMLVDERSTKEDKAIALKFIIHFIGDLHQPMHISRAEDEGGNKIQVNYEGKGTNLHSLWDSRLLEHQHLSYEQLAEQYDHVVTPAKVKAWQSDPLIKWIWESYTISSTLYKEVDAMKGRTIPEAYYQAHIGIIQERIEKAGVRLAGVLNTLLANGLPASAASKPAVKQAAPANPGPAKEIELQDVEKHVDEYVKVCGKVFGYKVLGNMTLVNVGAAYPDQLLTIVLKGDAKNAYEGLEGKTVCVTGKIILYSHKPEIIVNDPKDIK